jgi:hypothetical protein
VGAYSLRYLHRRRRMLRGVAAGPPELFAPVGVASALARPLSPRAFRIALDATEAANVAFLLGWRHRVSGPAYATSLLALLTYRNSWSMIYHNDNVLVLHALVLGAAPAADAVSVDAWTRARRGTPVPAGADGRYGWPIQLMNTVTALTYFLAAVAKLRGPLGRGWTSGEALRGQIAVDGLRKELLGDRAAPMAYRLFEQVRLFRLLAAGSLVLEAIAPAMLADRRLARLWAINAFAMHWGIYALMKITFRYQMSGIAFAPFVPLERAPEAARALAALRR